MIKTDKAYTKKARKWRQRCSYQHQTSGVWNICRCEATQGDADEADGAERKLKERRLYRGEPKPLHSSKNQRPPLRAIQKHPHLD